MDKSTRGARVAAVNAEIALMRESVGASSESQLAEMLGVTQASISQWRRRGNIPDKARKRIESYRLLGRDRLEMQDRAAALGPQLMFEGRCLALFLAPSRDAIETRRIALPHYEEQWREYATIFERICLACAEEVAERKEKIDGTAGEAMADLTRDDPADLLARVMQRARAEIRPGG